MEKTTNNLCDSCINIRCMFQSGIVRKKCDFYIPPYIGTTYNFIGVYEALPSKCNPGDVVTLMICFRGGKTIYRNYICYEENIWSLLDNKIGYGKLKETEDQK